MPIIAVSYNPYVVRTTITTRVDTNLQTTDVIFANTSQHRATLLVDQNPERVLQGIRLQTTRGEGAHVALLAPMLNVYTVATSLLIRIEYHSPSPGQAMVDALGVLNLNAAPDVIQSQIMTSIPSTADDPNRFGSG